MWPGPLVTKTDHQQQLLGFTLFDGHLDRETMGFAGRMSLCRERGRGIPRPIVVRLRIW